MRQVNALFKVAKKTKIVRIRCFWIALLIPFTLNGTPLSYKVIREIPHDRDAFTQGLIVQDGMIWESTGSPGGGTRIRQIDPADGRVVKSTKRDDSFFGEGLACDGLSLFQLSWQSQKVFVYRYPSILPVTTIPYKGEGWGLTMDRSNQFWMSNGSDTITVRDCCRFQTIKRIPIKRDGKPVKKLNELEWHDNALWANVWYSDSILKIDPNSGKVTGVLNIAPLRKKSGATGDDQVVNGIASAGKNRLWVTGKFWPKIYLIELTEPIAKPTSKANK